MVLTSSVGKEEEEEEEVPLWYWPAVGKEEEEEVPLRNWPVVGKEEEGDEVPLQELTSSG